MMRPGFSDDLIAEQRKQTVALERIAAVLEGLVILKNPVPFEAESLAGIGLIEVLKGRVTLKDIIK